MINLIVLYGPPTDVEQFDKHYFDVHIPLAQKMPGLRSFTVSLDPGTLMGSDNHLVAQLTWDDQASYEQDMSSEAGRASGADMANLAAICPQISAYVTEPKVV